MTSRRPSTTLKICYFGAYKPDYARNSILRKGLLAHGVEVIECRIAPEMKLWRQPLALLRRYRRISHDFDAFVIAEMNQWNLILAKFLSLVSRKPLVFDIFCSLYDSYVHDRKTLRADSLKARCFYGLDRLSLQLSDCILADTDQHRLYYQTFLRSAARKIEILRIGFDDSVFYRQDDVSEKSRSDSTCNVTFIGTFIPLHGIEYILHAAKLLESDKDIHFNLIGKGQTWPQMRELAERLDLRNCSFIEPVPLEQLPELILRSDIRLGIFGNTAKAQRVIPNKVYQYLAMRKPVITGDSPAIHEVFQAERDVLLCPMADEHALAKAIIRLKTAPGVRDRLAKAGYHHVHTHFTPVELGSLLKKIIISVL